LLFYEQIIQNLPDKETPVIGFNTTDRRSFEILI